MYVHVFLMDQDIEFDCALHVYNYLCIMYQNIVPSCSINGPNLQKNDWLCQLELSRKS